MALELCKMQTRLVCLALNQEEEKKENSYKQQKPFQCDISGSHVDICSQDADAALTLQCHGKFLYNFVHNLKSDFCWENGKHLNVCRVMGHIRMSTGMGETLLNNHMSLIPLRITALSVEANIKEP